MLVFEASGRYLRKRPNMPTFNSKKAVDQWRRLVNDLQAASSEGDTITGKALKERAIRLGAVMNDAPAVAMDPKFKEISKTLEGLKASISKIEKDTDPKNKDSNEKQQQKIQSQLEDIEKKIAQRALGASSTMGRALLKEATRRQKEAYRDFVKETKQSNATTQKVLAKQLIEVSERRGLNDSDSLKELEADLIKGLKALQLEDFKQFKAISEKLSDMEENYGTSSETSGRLNDIRDLVETKANRSRAKREKLGGMIESGADRIGLGSVVRGVKRTARATASTYRGIRSLKNATLRGGKAVFSTTKSILAKGSRTLSGIAARLSSDRDPESSGGVRSLMANLLGGKGSAESAREATADKEESNLQRRQVAALEILSRAVKSGKKAGGSLVSSGVGGLKSLTGSLGKFALAGAKFLGPLLAKLGLLGAAAFAGWSLGSFVYEKFATEIQDGIEVVVGIVKKGIDFAGKGFEWFKSFISSPVDKIKEIGGKLKDAWDKSVFAKFFSDPGKVMMEGASSLLNLVSNAAQAGAAKVSDLSKKALSSATSVLSPALAPLSSLGSQIGLAAYDTVDAVSSSVALGYNSLKSAAGKLFNVRSGVNLEGLDPAVQSNFLAMASEFKSRGGTGSININSGYRDMAKQAALYKADPSKAAPPGRSSHNFGLALDIDSVGANKLDSMGLLSKYGFSRPVPREPWHLQAKGTASVLSAKGMFSADSPVNQRMGANPRGSTNAAPAVASIPPYSESQSSSARESGGSSGQPAPVVQGPTFQGSVSTIPTFSFLDQGFFMMNIGTLSN